jgi:hypothetical protein
MPLLLTAAVLIASLALPPAASQTRGATAQPAIRACSLLTRELVRKVTPYEGKALEISLAGGPEENTLGAGGSDCSDGGISLLVDPRFSFDSFRKQKGWEQAEHIAGVGDEALFHDNIGEWAEMVVRSGSHVFTIQMDIPTGKTAASVKPNVVALAKAILPALH